MRYFCFSLQGSAVHIHIPSKRQLYQKLEGSKKKIAANLPTQKDLDQPDTHNDTDVWDKASSFNTSVFSNDSNSVSNLSAPSTSDKQSLPLSELIAPPASLKSDGLSVPSPHLSTNIGSPSPLDAFRSHQRLFQLSQNLSAKDLNMFAQKYNALLATTLPPPPHQLPNPFLIIYRNGNLFPVIKSELNDPVFQKGTWEVVSPVVGISLGNYVSKIIITFSKLEFF